MNEPAADCRDTGHYLDAQQMAAALAAGRVTLFAWHIEQDIVQWSLEAAALLGGDAAASLPGFHDFLQLVHPDDRSNLQARVKRALAEPDTHFEAQYRLRRLDGSEFWALGSGVVRCNREGRPHSLVGAIVDIGGVKDLEGQQWKEQKLESTGMLAGGVAHDFNNLLQVMVGEVQRAQQLLAADSPAQVCIANVLAAAARGQQLTHRLLAFARRQDLQLDTFAADQLLLGAEGRLRQTLGDDIVLRLQLEPSPGFVRADRGQIEAVLMQLATNARQAMPHGGTLAIALDQLELRPGQTPPHVGVAAGRWVRLRVADDGVGMDAATRNRVFEPFFTTRIDAPGLGLSTCHGIVRQLGGHIWVDSVPGHGSTFTVLLPRGEQLLEPPPKPADVSPMAVRLLLVEDDDVLRTMLAGALRAEGFQVLAAATGREALELAERHPDSIRILVTDLVLPGIGGVELAERLQRRRPGIRVLYITGYRERLIELLDQHETAAVLGKPFTGAELIGRVHDLLADGNRRQAAPT